MTQIVSVNLPVRMIAVMTFMRRELNRARPLRHFATAWMLVLVTACASHPRHAAIQPVGPAPQTNPKPGAEGYLIVYSAWSNFVDQGSIGHHSRYTITPDSGANAREIINYADRFDEGPIRLALRAGAYQVRARSTHFGRINVPVVIHPHQTTFVYLDGAFHAEAPSAQEKDVVRLPNGEVVGWSATIANNNSP